MIPPIIVGFPKRVPEGGDTICGKFVPAGTDICVNFLSMVRNKEVFGDDADTFRPERFLECDEAKKVELYKVVDLAFGHGRWMCPGKTIARIELDKIFVEVSNISISFLHYPLFFVLTDFLLAFEKLRFSNRKPGVSVEVEGLFELLD